MRPSIDSWPASSHTLPPIKSRSTPPLQRSGVTLLRLPGASAPDLRESRGSSAPADASAGSAIKKLTGPDASFPCALCGRTSNRHSQRTVFSASWLCVLEFLSSLALRAGDLQRELLLFSACLHGENSPASSHVSVSVLIKNAFKKMLKAPRSIVFEWLDARSLDAASRKPTPTVRATQDEDECW